MHEIVTLQFGQRANYVGTHFWNTQESYFTYGASDSPSIVDHDICFRPGIGSDGADTYTPRAIVYDLKSGFGSLKKINALYETVDDPAVVRNVWDSTQQIQTAPPITPSPYQVALETGSSTPQLQSRDVRYWSDYNRIFFHPRSLVQLSAQSLTSQLAAFESYSAGVELFKSLDQEVGGLLDQDLRLFAEECDSLQGFQSFGSSDDAWGGFMSQYIEAIREEYGKKSIWAWGMEDGRNVERTKLYTKLTNSAHTLSALAADTTAYIPLSTVPPRGVSHTNIELDSGWSTGALLSSIIESVTLPTRLRPSRGIRTSNMAVFESVLGGSSKRNVWQLQARARPVDDSEAEESSQNTDAANGLANDIRINQARDGADEVLVGDEAEEIQPSSFDLDFTPKLPQVQETFPSLRSPQTSNSSRLHLFAQVESYRYSTRSRFSSPSPSMPHTTASIQDRLRRLYNDECIVEVYNTPLPYPLLDSFPQNLFTFPPPRDLTRTSHTIASTTTTTATSDLGSRKQHSLNICAALSTSSATKGDILALRDIVVGRTGRALGLVDINDREAMYDDLSKLAEEYTYGFEDDEDDLVEGGGDGGGSDYD